MGVWGISVNIRPFRVIRPSTRVPSVLKHSATFSRPCGARRRQIPEGRVKHHRKPDTVKTCDYQRNGVRSMGNHVTSLSFLENGQ